MIRQFIFLAGLVALPPLYAEITFQSGHIIVEEIAHPEIEVICSKVQKKLILERINFDYTGVQAGWSSEVAPFTCSILFVDHAPFVFSCRTLSGALSENVDCQTVTLTSHFPWQGTMLTGSLPESSYWIAENIASDDLPPVLRHKGFDV